MNPNPKSMKKIILSSIRNSLIELGSATKVELNEKLDISFPTISKFLTQMEKDGEILSIGLDESSGGRRAKRYRYNPEYMLGLAIFLEGTETNYIIFDCLGEIKEQAKSSSVLKEGHLQSLTNLIENVITSYPKISSIAIGVPGAVDNGKIFHIPGYEPFKHVDLKRIYEEYFSIPVVVENDMNAAVLGYYHNNGIKDKQSLIYLYFGQNGPGAGFMINGDVVRGSTFFAGEVQYVPMDLDRNFGQSLGTRRDLKVKTVFDQEQIDAISRLIATFVAIMNPHNIVFNRDEVGTEMIKKITTSCSNYIPSKHLPKLTLSDWKKDYLSGLQNLGLDLIL